MTRNQLKKYGLKFDHKYVALDGDVIMGSGQTKKCAIYDPNRTADDLGISRKQWTVELIEENQVA